MSSHNTPAPGSLAHIPTRTLNAGRTRYLLPAMITQRRQALAWIMAHRPRKNCYALALLRDTPAYIAQQWRNGRLVEYAAQLAVITALALPAGMVFGLYF